MWIPTLLAKMMKRLEALLGGAGVIDMAHAGALRTRLAGIPKAPRFRPEISP